MIVVKTDHPRATELKIPVRITNSSANSTLSLMKGFDCLMAQKADRGLALARATLAIALIANLLERYNSSDDQEAV